MRLQRKCHENEGISKETKLIRCDKQNNSSFKFFDFEFFKLKTQIDCGRKGGEIEKTRTLQPLGYYIYFIPSFLQMISGDILGLRQNRSYDVTGKIVIYEGGPIIIVPNIKTKDSEEENHFISQHSHLQLQYTWYICMSSRLRPSQNF